MRGSRYQAHAHAFRPHPEVRALFVKDVLLKAASQLWKFEQEKFGTFLDERLEEMHMALQDLELSDNWHFTENYRNQITAKRFDVDLLQWQFQSSCDSWRWVSWSSKAR